MPFLDSGIPGGLTPEEQRRQRLFTILGGLQGLGQQRGGGGFLGGLLAGFGGGIGGQLQGEQYALEGRRQVRDDQRLERQNQLAELTLGAQLEKAQQDRQSRQAAMTALEQAAAAETDPRRARALQLAGMLGAPEKALDLLKPPDAIEPKVVQGVGLVQQQPDGTFKTVVAEGAPSLTPYQQLEAGFERERLDLSRQQAAAAAAQQRVPDLVAVQTPQGPRLVPKSQAAGLTPADTREQGGPKQEADLRKELNNLDEVKLYKGVVPAIKSAARSAPQTDRQSDLDLVFAVGKTLDPGSVVREGEQVSIQKTGGIYDTFQGYANSFGGGAALTPDVRAGLIRILRNRGNALAEGARARRSEYQGYAKDYGLDPDRSTGGFDELPDFDELERVLTGKPASPVRDGTEATDAAQALARVNPAIGF